MKSPCTYKANFNAAAPKNGITNGRRHIIQQQRELIHSTVAKGAASDELKLFLIIANRAGPSRLLPDKSILLNVAADSPSATGEGSEKLPDVPEEQTEKTPTYKPGVRDEP